LPIARQFLSKFFVEKGPASRLVYACIDWARFGQALHKKWFFNALGYGDRWPSAKGAAGEFLCKVHNFALVLWQFDSIKLAAAGVNAHAAPGKRTSAEGGDAR
jgi:hypothetical protein